jgi:uncharacterized protein (TIGR02600 family)
MNNRPPLVASPRPKLSGAALVVTLAFLVLLLALTVGLFLTANSELRSASLYKNSQGVRELADSAVNLVMVQIKDATTTNASSAPDSRSTWASQPGMIRTYGSSTNAAMSYKLFSWSNPRVSGDDTTTVPANWSSTPALYTDLNEPVPDSQTPSDTNAYRYPIAYPPTTGTNAPLGYSVANAPTATGGAFTNSVPMPVQWLYMLKDGTLINPSSATGNTATITGASASNPIVARIAYWTDDETSKVNVNTAAGGEYWGPLVQKTLRQLTNSYWIPARWEYQRYPGHPARTDLQAVFPDLTRQQIWAFTPRISDNGATAVSAMTTSPTSVAADSDRLLASVGEARFQANPSGSTRADFPAAPISTGSGNLTWSDRIERNKFLITASSRAPEVTLYGTPRISVWPLATNTNSSYRTTLDSLFAFCSTIQKTTNAANPVTPGIPRPYYFVRGAQHANNQTSLNGDTNNPINTNMFNYLDSLSGNTNIPGFGTVSLATKYTTAGRDQLVTQFYDYIRTINRNDRGIPGSSQFCWNSSGSGSAFVMPVKRTNSTGTTYGFGRFHTINQVAIHFICTADGADTNSANTNNLSLWTNTNAASYVPLATNEVCIQAIAYIEPASPGVASPYLQLGDGNLLNQDYSFNVRGLNALSIGTNALGFPSLAKIYAATYPTSAGNVNSGRSGGILKYLLFLTGTYTKPPEARGGFTNIDPLTFTIGTNSVTLTGRDKKTATVNGIANVPLSSTISGTNLGGSYPLVSDPIRISKGGSMNLSASTINIDTVFKYYGNTFTNTTTIPFPAATIPMPTLSPNKNQWAFYPIGWDGTSTNSATSSGRFPIVNTNNLSWETNLIVPNYDTVFAVATKHGDYRISMARPGSAANWAPVPANPAFPSMQHRLFNGASSGTTNYWVPGANYPSNAFGLLPTQNASTRPAIPDKAYLDGLGIAHPLTYGDFDNGLAVMPDGPYINTPDDMASYPSGQYNGWTESYDLSALNDIFMTPNRKIASPISFGSLPSAAVFDRPWQNLLFRPAPGVDHPGKAGFKIDGTSLTGAPPDHVWLDFFWMPVVEPWAISETFSTAGKINMNYQIVPFSYIRRTTGVQAVLRTGGVTAVSSAPSGYTTSAYDKTTSGRPKDNSPFPVNLDETLKGFDERLTNNAALFRTASEICELPIVPVATNATYSSLQDGSWWTNWQYTGDNTKEATYNDIYPRLTTKGNTYTVHYRVQVLKKLPGGDQTTWDESKDKVASELRGSTLVERYLDPNATYPDYATAFSSSPSLETFYRFRVLQRSDFTP